MARLWSAGFELNSTTNNVEFTAVSGSPTIQTTTVRSGTYAVRINSLVSATAKSLRYDFAAAAANGPYFARFYLNYTTAPSADNTIMTLLAAAAVRASIKLTSTGTLLLFDEDGQIGSASTALSSGSWYRVEVEFNISAAAGSHVVRAKLDGTEFAGSATRNIAAGINRMTVGGNLASEAQTQGDWYIDDLAVNDNSGSFQNSYPGAGSIVHLRPNATGDNNAWDGLTTDWQKVDEVTPDDGTTRISSSVLDNIDDYNIDDAGTGIDTINVVQAGVRFAGDATSANASFVVRVKASSGGTVEESAALTPALTTYVTNATAVPRNHPLTLYDLPGASTTAWTNSGLDNAQIGVRCSTGNTNVAYVTALWLLVEYQTSAASAATHSNLMMMGIG